MSLTSRTLKLAAVAIAAVASTAALAETIVVRSNGPSAKAYPPGRSLPDNSQVALKPGDVLTVLDGQGTRVLKGPGTYSTTASARANSSFGQLLRNTGQRQARTGAVRGGNSSAPKPTNVWLVDTSKSGQVCVAGGSAVTLWRPNATAAGSYAVTRVGDGKTATVDFRVGEPTRSWPLAELPVANGDQFRISGTGMTNPSTIKVAVLGPNPEGLEGTAAAFIRNNCTTQLDLLIETVTAPGADAAPAG